MKLVSGLELDDFTLEKYVEKREDEEKRGMFVSHKANSVTVVLSELDKVDEVHGAAPLDPRLAKQISDLGTKDIRIENLEAVNFEPTVKGTVIRDNGMRLRREKSIVSEGDWFYLPKGAQMEIVGGFQEYPWMSFYATVEQREKFGAMVRQPDSDAASDSASENRLKIRYGGTYWQCPAGCFFNDASSSFICPPGERCLRHLGNTGVELEGWTSLFSLPNPRSGSRGKNLVSVGGFQSGSTAYYVDLQGNPLVVYSKSAGASR